MDIPVLDNTWHEAEPLNGANSNHKLPLVVIVGINGRQGTSVAKAFLENGSYHIRGLTSSPDCPSSENWKRLGVEIREETYMDLQHVHASFKGAQVIFASTCYHKIFKNRRASLAFQVGMINKGKSQYAMERDVDTGQMILDAAAEVLSLERFVMSTLPVLQSVVTYATNKATGESVAKVLQIEHLKNTLPDLWKKTILVKPAPRMEDISSSLRMVSFALPMKLQARLASLEKENTQPATQRQDGTLFIGTTAPAEVSFFWLSMTKDFGVQVRTLVEHLPFSSYAFAAYSDKLSGEEIRNLISKISGRPCTYQQHQPENLEQLEQDALSNLLPLPLGSLLYDQDIFTPTSLNETFKPHNISVTQTSFEEYLTTVLPGQLHRLQGTSGEGPTHVHEVNIEPMTPSLMKLLQEHQNMLDGMEEAFDKDFMDVPQGGQSKDSPFNTGQGPFQDSPFNTGQGLSKDLSFNTGQVPSKDLSVNTGQGPSKDLPLNTGQGPSKDSSSNTGQGPSKNSSFNTGPNPFKKDSPLNTGPSPFKKDSPFHAGADPFMGVAAEDTVRECMELFGLDPDKSRDLYKDFGIRR